MFDGDTVPNGWGTSSCMSHLHEFEGFPQRKPPRKNQGSFSTPPPPQNLEGNKTRNLFDPSLSSATAGDSAFGQPERWLVQRLG